MLPSLARLSLYAEPTGVKPPYTKPPEVVELDRRWAEAEKNGTLPEGLEKFPLLVKLWKTIPSFQLPNPKQGSTKQGWRMVGNGVLTAEGGEIATIRDPDDPTKEIAVQDIKAQLIMFKKQIKAQGAKKAPASTLEILTDESDSNNKRRANALLRFWFSRNGRQWHLVDNEHWKRHKANVKVYSDFVTRNTHYARLEWARMAVKSMDPNVEIPIPPPDLFIPGYDVMPMEVLVPSAATLFGDGAIVQLPAFLGPTMSVSFASVMGLSALATSAVTADGVTVIAFVKHIQRLFERQTVAAGGTLMQPPAWMASHVNPLNYLTSKATLDAKLLSQSATLKVTYQEFMMALNKMGATFQNEFFTKINEVYEYTETSSRYNFPLRYKVASWQPVVDVVEASGDGAQRQAALRQCVPLINEELKTVGFTVDVPYLTEALKKVHGLWKLMSMAPRAPDDILVFRSENSWRNLPHQLAGVTEPVEGQRFLLPGFTSTTVAAPSGYFDGGSPLSTFFNDMSMCCIYIILIKKDTPMIPAYMAGNTAFASEREIILGALTELTFTGKQLVTKDTAIFPTSASVMVWSYSASSYFTN